MESSSVFFCSQETEARCQLTASPLDYVKGHLSSFVPRRTETVTLPFPREASRKRCVSHVSLSLSQFVTLAFFPRDGLHFFNQPTKKQAFHPIFVEYYLGLVLAEQAGDPGAHGRLRRRLGATLGLGTGCEWSVTV